MTENSFLASTTYVWPCSKTPSRNEFMHTYTDQMIRSILTPKAVVNALRDMFSQGAEVPERHHHSVSTNRETATLLIMPAWQVSNDNGSYSGVKIVTVYQQNSAIGLPSIQGSYFLFDKTTGTPKAVLDGGTLTLFRTAAASALAATYLARPESTRLLIVGTGTLVPHIAKTYKEVLGISEIKIWGRNHEKASSKVQELRSLGIDASISRNLKEGVRWADIVSCATTSTQPLILGEWLQSGQHIDLIGGFTYEMRETDDQAVSRAALFADTRAGVLSEAGDFLQPIDKGIISESDILADLYDLCTNTHQGRSSNTEITLFKSVGTALEDLAAAKLVYELSHNND